MANVPVHDYFVVNGELKSTIEFKPNENDGGIYEVVRVIQGFPLFLKEHLERLFISAKIANKSIKFSETEIGQFLIKLIDANNTEDGNIFISYQNNLNIFFIAHKYPTIELYKNGIYCGILKAERENPNAKVIQTTVRQKADKIMTRKGYYEVLLMDHKNRITEGSRSNVFFIRNNVIITPPGNEVLLGITRKKAIFLSAKMGCKLKEADVFFDDLKTFQAAFITGTSPQFLPIKQIDGLSYDPQNKIVQQLIEDYNKLIYSTESRELL